MFFCLLSAYYFYGPSFHTLCQVQHPMLIFIYIQHLKRQTFELFIKIECKVVRSDLLFFVIYNMLSMFIFVVKDQETRMLSLCCCNLSNFFHCELILTSCSCLISTLNSCYVKSTVHVLVKFKGRMVF